MGMWMTKGILKYKEEAAGEGRRLLMRVLQFLLLNELY